MLQAIVFDMGNVLVHFNHEKMLAQMGALCGRSAAAMRTLLFDDGLYWNFERGHFSPDEFRQRLEAATGVRLNLTDLATATADIFQLNAPMVPLLEELQARGLRLVLLSNTCLWHFEFIWERFGILQRFDEWVVSYHVGAIKPEAAMFQAAKRAVQCPPDRALYTDDIPAYVDLGRAQGLQARVFTDVSALRRDLAALGID